MKILKLFNMIAVSTLLMTSCGGSSDSGGGGGGDEGTVTGNTITVDHGDYTALASSSFSGGVNTLGIGGGSIEVTDGPLQGLKIQAAAGATDEDITFNISYADVSGSSGLPEGASLWGKIVKIEASGSDSWNSYRMFNDNIGVTLPYTDPGDANIEEMMNVFALDSNGGLNTVGYEGFDTTNNTLTFYTRTIADTAPASILNADVSAQVAGVGKNYVTDLLTTINRLTPSLTYMTYVTAASKAFDDLKGTSIDTGFAPSKDGFYIPNMGSAMEGSNGGNCLGMVSYARWYYRYLGNEDESYHLYNQFRDAGNTETWTDDSTAIELASRAQAAENNIVEERFNDEHSWQISTNDSQRRVALSLLGAMGNSGNPVMIGLLKKGAGGGVFGGHAVLAYGADIGADGTVTFHIYDPNDPYRTSTDEFQWQRTLVWSESGGFEPYSAALNAKGSTSDYNWIKHYGYQTFISDNVYADMTRGASRDFEDESLFPTIAITSISGVTNSENVMTHECTDPATGQHCYETTDSVIRITGTVSGGSGDVNVTNVYAYLGDNGNEISANVSGGSFSLDMIVPQGYYSDLKIVAAENEDFVGWAGFYHNVIKSTVSSLADMEVTLTWLQDSTDVDIYVREPDFTVDMGGGSTLNYTGDTVYWQNKRTSSGNHPYQDVDDTNGYGPEHYFARNGMTTLASNRSTENPDGLYGSYKLKVHYYSGSVPISWKLEWRYLAYCASSDAAECVDSGFWTTGSQTGTLSTASSSNCCDFDNTGNDWSDEVTVSYSEPTASDYTIPNPNDIMLP